MTTKGKTITAAVMSAIAVLANIFFIWLLFELDREEIPESHGVVAAFAFYIIIFWFIAAHALSIPSIVLSAKTIKYYKISIVTLVVACLCLITPFAFIIIMIIN